MVGLWVPEIISGSGYGLTEFLKSLLVPDRDPCIKTTEVKECLPDLNQCRPIYYNDTYMIYIACVL